MPQLLQPQEADGKFDPLKILEHTYRDVRQVWSR
jgi:hypothetical protein